MRSRVKKFIYKIVHFAASGIVEQLTANRFSSHVAPLFTNWSYLPLTNWAPGPEFLCHISNEICINNRRNIVEFGTGVTTIILARLAKINSLPLRITTIDQSQEWQEIVKQLAARDGVESYIKFIHNPIIPRVHGNIAEIQKRVFSQEDRFDCAIIDGPVSGHEFRRKDTVAVIKTYLYDQFTIFFHDTDRNEEKQLAKYWASQFSDVHLAFFARHAVLSTRGNMFESVPQRQV